MFEELIVGQRFKKTPDVKAYLRLSFSLEICEVFLSACLSWLRMSNFFLTVDYILWALFNQVTLFLQTFGGSKTIIILLEQLRWSIVVTKFSIFITILF